MIEPIVLETEDILAAIRDYVMNNKLLTGTSTSPVHLRILVQDTEQEGLKYLDGDTLRFLILISEELPEPA